MQDKFFTVLLDNTVDFTDKSKSLKEYDTPATSLELTTADTLYVGYSKPFNSFYIGLDTVSSTGTTLTAEYYNGTAWTDLDICDETIGMSKSGFIHFEKPVDMSKVAVDSMEKFYIRIKADINTGAVTGKYLDILFSSDTDLEKIRENIVSKFALTGSWTAKHIAARDHIIQEVRNSGNVKEVTLNEGLIDEEVILKDITKFDFLEPLQLRVASKYFTMYLIFFYELSDEEGDKWEIKAKDMYKLYTDAMETFFIAIDKDEDGKQNEGDTSVPTDTIRSIVLGE